MSVHGHDREPRGNRLSEHPRRISRRPLCNRHGSAHRPCLELLESRVVLSPTIFTVNSTGSGTSGSGTSGTLPYVISQANASPNTAGSEIEFASSVFLSRKTITLSATLVLTETAGPEVIDGPGLGHVTVSGGDTVRVFDVDSGVTATVSGLTVANGEAASGGGIYNNGNGTLTITNCSITGNQSTIVDGNGGGGGIINYGTLNLSSTTVTDNSAFISGGGVYNKGSATLTDCTVSGNSADSGGGLANGGSGAATLTLSNCTITGNSNVTFDGGGIDNEDGTATLSDCTISGNSAGFDGGGIYSGFGGTLTLSDSTITGNSAGAFGGGGVGTDGAATLIDCTISGNSAGESGGGGVYRPFGRGTTTITGTIVAGNTGYLGASSDIGGNQADQVTGSYNLIGTGGSGGIVGGTDGNIVLNSLADLGLTPLGNFGGPTETMALLPGSAAIGAGTAMSGITSDQRGLPLDSAPDIGAFQSQGFTFTPIAGGTNQETTNGTAFANPLAVVVTANNPIEPVVGGTVTFSVPRRAPRPVSRPTRSQSGPTISPRSWPRTTRLPAHTSSPPRMPLPRPFRSG